MLNETEADRLNQTEIADFVQRRYHFDGYVWLSPFGYRLDGCFYKADGLTRQPKQFFEAKCRSFAFGRYKEGYNISVGKLMAAHWLHDVTGLRSALYARFSDGVIAATDITHHQYGLVIGGRTDRNQPYDIEPMAQIPWDKFKIIRDATQKIAPASTCSSPILNNLG
jgi:hypothetical protein